MKQKYNDHTLICIRIICDHTAVLSLFDFSIIACSSAEKLAYRIQLQTFPLPFHPHHSI